MALPMIHLEVAYLAANGLRPADLAAYLLGAIAPDGVHTRSPYRGEMKDASHYDMHGETHLSEEEAARRLLTLASKGDYCLGYAVHLYTDLLWHSRVFLSGESFRFHKPDGSRDKRLYYAEVDKFDLWLYDTSPRRAKMWRLLARARGEDLDVLTAAEAEAWRDRMLPWYEQHRARIEALPAPRLLTKEDILTFIETTANDCIARFSTTRPIKTP